MCSRTERGQSTVEAAFLLPVLFVLMLMLLQPGIILYDRLIMRSAAAEGCRLAATMCQESAFDESVCCDVVKRRLGAVPPNDLFHMHEGTCAWDVHIEGDASSDRVTVTIRNRVRLVPLLDAAGVLLGIAPDGCLDIDVSETCVARPDWFGGYANPWEYERK